MPDRFTLEEFRQLMEPWDRREREIVEERFRTGFSRPRLEQFTDDEASTMKAALDRLIPQDEDVDLVGFIDWGAGRPLGRGDRRAGMPDEVTLFREGLCGLDQTAQVRHGRPFAELSEAGRDDVLDAVQRGAAEGEIWSRIPSDYFFKRFYAKALTGYLAHPRVWMRIGFMGAGYPEGYVWIDTAEVAQRHVRGPGWDRL